MMTASPGFGRPVRVLMVVDSHNLSRALCSLLQTEAELEVVGEVALGPEAIEWAVQEAANTAVIQLGMPADRGMRLIQQFAETSPETRILALSLKRDMAFADHVLSVGADVCLWSEHAFEELVPAICEI